MDTQIGYTQDIERCREFWVLAYDNAKTDLRGILNDLLDPETFQNVCTIKNDKLASIKYTKRVKITGKSIMKRKCVILISEQLKMLNSL